MVTDDHGSEPHELAASGEGVAPTVAGTDASGVGALPDDIDDLSVADTVRLIENPPDGISIQAILDHERAREKPRAGVLRADPSGAAAAPASAPPAKGPTAATIYPVDEFASHIPGVPVLTLEPQSVAKSKLPQLRAAAAAVGITLNITEDA